MLGIFTFTAGQFCLGFVAQGEILSEYPWPHLASHYNKLKLLCSYYQRFVNMSHCNKQMAQINLVT